jgi:hypothetical protein
MSIETIKSSAQSGFQFLNKYVIYVLLAAIAVLLFMYSVERSGKNDLSNNLIIAKDSVTYHKNRANELYAQVGTHIITEKQLKEANGELYAEVNKYKKQKPLVIVQEKIKIEYRDTTLTTSISSKLDKDGNKEFDITWKSDSIFDKDNYIKINGMAYLKIDSTLQILKHGAYLNKLELGTKLILGVNEDKSGKLVINARTDFPGLIFSDIEGYIIDPMKSQSFKNLAKKKRYGISAFGGVGTYFNGGGIKFIPTVGVGLSYDLISF